MYWYVNPVIDTIFGKAEATGLLDRMVLNTPIKGIGNATLDNYNTYVSLLYESALTEFGYRLKDGQEMETAGGSYGGLWVNIINDLYQTEFGIENAFSKQGLIKYAVFFGYLLNFPENQGLDVNLSKELDELVGRIAGPGEKYNTKVYMNTEMFRIIITLIFDLHIGEFKKYVGFLPDDGEIAASAWGAVYGYNPRWKSPYNEYTYPPDFFISDKIPLLNGEEDLYPNLFGLTKITPKPYFMNWNKTNPFL